MAPNLEDLSLGSLVCSLLWLFLDRRGGAEDKPLSATGETQAQDKEWYSLRLALAQTGQQAICFIVVETAIYC